jgi:LruC domain-containing protein
VAHISFKSPKSSLSKPPYNPFIFATTQRGIETHLVDLPPTDLADKRFFGTQNDDSSIADKRYYRTPTNLPWALDIPDNWSYMAEKQDITLAYNLFEPWAESKGAKNTDWYLKPSNSRYIYVGQ